MTDPAPKRKIDFQSFDNPEFWVGEYATFAQEVGYAAWAWNALHADLCDLFWTITGIADGPKVPRAIWHSIKSDRGQRDMLNDAAKARITNDDGCLAEIRWLLEEINQISRIRNDSAHTLWAVDNSPITDAASARAWINHKAKPDIERGNPKGKRLIGKPAGVIFRTLAGYCMTLIQYCRFLDIRVRGWNNGDPLPARPERPDVLRY